MSVSARLRALFGKSAQQGIEQATAVRHPFFDRCVHGTGFLDECQQCPDGRPVIKTESPRVINEKEGNTRA